MTVEEDFEDWIENIHINFIKKYDKMIDDDIATLGASLIIRHKDKLYMSYERG